MTSDPDGWPLGNTAMRKLLAVVADHADAVDLP
jgi:hypothetical protein